MKLTKLVTGLAAASTGLALTVAGLATPASAATTPTYGFDGNAHIIVSGGSDTTYKAMTAIADIWNTSSIAGCTTQTTPTGPNQNPALNQCNPSGQSPSLPGGNFDRDTVANASPTGSSAGIASLNDDAVISSTQTAGPFPYQGTTGTVDFARSSRAPKTSGGNCNSGAVPGNELSCDTFWGFAEDGVEVFTFGTHGGVSGLTPADLFHIWNCDYKTWNQVTDLNLPNDTAPIVPWGMNSASGTYGTFNSYLVSAGQAPSNFTVDTKVSANPYPQSPNCVRQLSTSNPPFENDVKPLFQDVATNGGGLTTSGVNDPDNWIWFGSYGLLSKFAYDSNFTTTAGTTYTATPDAINGSLPSTSTIVRGTYPIDRTLYHVTLKTAADCPSAGGPGTTCDFTGNPGPALPGGGTDLNVTGATGGTGGAVREFTRFLCRNTTSQSGVDPYTGVNLLSEVSNAVTGSGFTPVPPSLKTTGSSCEVMH